MTSELEQWAADMVRARVPFKAHGRDRSGLDCWGLARLGYLEAGGREFASHSEEYDGVRDFIRLQELFERHRDREGWIKVEPEKPFDLVLLRLRGLPIHVGLVIGGGRMVHIEENIEVCVENYKSAMWRNRVLGFYRPRSD